MLLCKKIKNKINNKKNCVHVVEMDDEDVPDDVLEEASAAKYHMLPTKSKLRYQKS
jgi:hypothetical protein